MVAVAYGITGEVLLIVAAAVEELVSYIQLQVQMLIKLYEYSGSA